MITGLALIVVILGAMAAFLVIADSGVRAFEAMAMIRRELARSKVPLTSVPAHRAVGGSPRLVASALTPGLPGMRRAA